jgi:hypothetical protein
MKLLRAVALAWMYLCFATAMAEAGLIAVLWQRGQLNANTMNNLFVVARDVPIREMHDQLVAQAQPLPEEMVSFAEVETARMLTILDLDLRDLSADKGLADAHELSQLLEEETIRYSQLKDEFDTRWDAMQKNAVDSQLLDVGRQIATVTPSLAKDQLLRILEDEKLEPDTALRQVVTIFRSLPIDKRKKIILEFKDQDTANLHEIMRQIRLGMPQTSLLRETREKIDQFRTQR